MGRGRAKAKQQKVARALKYSTHDTDLTALQRELRGEPATSPPSVETTTWTTTSTTPTTTGPPRAADAR